MRENVTTIKNERDGPNQGLQLVDNTVKYTNKILMEKRELVKENEILKNKIEALDSMRVNGDQEREKFFEGAAWAARQCADAGAKALKAATEVRY